MRFDYPRDAQIPQLRQLWKKAFGDTDAFLDLFFSTAFSPLRCRCATDEESVAAALYWFDISWDDQPCAYIYAVATDPDCRGQGLCRALMADAEETLQAQGYVGALLVPQDEGLFTMYAKMGYRPATAIREEICAAAQAPVPLREINSQEYAALRLSFLPRHSVIQEGENLAFLETAARFYVGEGFLAAVSREPDHLRILEFLGSSAAAPGLVAALGHTEATVRMPGESKPFSMYRTLSGTCSKPDYFAFCFD